MDEDTFKAFNDDLLEILKNDPEHQIKLTRTFSFWHVNTHNAIEVTDIHYDDKLGKIVFAGGFRKGMPEFNEDGSIKTDYEVPLSEVFADMKGARVDRTDDMYSSIHSAVVNKYYAGNIKGVYNNWEKHPDIEITDFMSEGSFVFDMIKGGRYSGVKSIINAGCYDNPTLLTFENSDKEAASLCKTPISNFSIRGIYELGKGLKELSAKIQEYKNIFRTERDKYAKPHNTQTELDWENGEMAGFRKLVEVKCPVGVLQVVIDNSLTLKGDLLKQCATKQQQIEYTTGELARILDKPLFSPKDAEKFLPHKTTNLADGKKMTLHL